MKCLFIINRSSGKQNIEQTLREIFAKLIMDQLCPTIDVFYTAGKDDAKNRALELKPGDYDFIVAVGGDGTLNEVTNGLVRSGSGIPLAVISAGTVNDFATYMKLPQNADEFCDMVRNFHTTKVDVGRVNDEYFINVLAGGLLTDVAYKVPKAKKAVMGKMAYYLECIKDLPSQLHNYKELRFESEEFTGTEEVLVFMVANTKSVGGFPQAAPDASVQDGLLDVLMLKKGKTGSILIDAPDLVFKILLGEHPNHDAITYFQTRNLKILAASEDDQVSLDYDGEILESGLPVEISIEPMALDLLITE